MNIDDQLKKLENKKILRSLNALPGCGGVICTDDQKLINFSSNDYLNLATDMRVKKAAYDAIDVWGCGSTGSRLLSGQLPLHESLEKCIAAMTDYPAALVFGSGFLTNVGIISALASPSDFIFFDRLDHASLIDGIRLSGAKWARFKHNNMDHVETLLKEKSGNVKQCFIIVDSVYSMDGDIAPVKELYDLAKKYNAQLIIDEAHAIGVFGENGGGICRQLGVKPDMITGTLSKSFGGYGGFVACSEKMKQWFINTARSFIFSTGLPPASVASSIEAIRIIKEEKVLGDTLLDRARFFSGLLKEMSFEVANSQSQIIPLMIRDNDLAVRFAETLGKSNIFVKAIRPPTVPPKTARLRISITLAHDEKILEQSAQIMRKTAQQLGIL